MGLPNKALEALCAGVPVVGRGCLANLEEMSSGAGGMIRCDTSSDFASALSAVCTDGDYRRQLADEATSLLSRWPTWSDIADAYLERSDDASIAM
jgi:glycosyltransferase involved in cell wall biosynthesis